VAVAVATRRLPGVVFEATPPPSPRVLPRMDVGAFIGFAAAGPMHVPVAVEDAAGFTEVFGEDAPLAWDADRGEQALAQLAPAVRAFFRNGGRRAWVVRVAGDSAHSSLLPIPGLAAGSRGGTLYLASLAARAPGSWADGLRVAAALSSSPAVLLSAELEDLAFEIEAGTAKIVPGDLLRIRSLPHELLVVVRAVSVAESAPHGALPQPGRTVLTVRGESGTALWFEAIEPPAGATGTAQFVDSAGIRRSAPAEVPIPEGSPPVPSSPPGSPPEPGETMALDLATPPALAPPPGTLLTVGDFANVPGLALWLRVDAVGDRDDGRVRITGRPSWSVVGTPDPLPELPAGAGVEKLTLELQVRRGDVERFVLDGLGFAPGHPRYLGDLPSDEQLYTPREFQLGPDPILWRDASHPRFPLAGGDEHGVVYYPLAVDVAFGTFLGPLHAPGSPLERDGLADYGDALFLDRGLRATGVESLASAADFIRWQSASPRRLAGVHALLDVEEVTFVAVPDAVHRRWTEAAEGETPPAPPSDEPAPTPEPESTFVDCVLRVLEPAPHLTLHPRDQGGSFGLSWTEVDEPGVRYVLQEGTDPRGWERAETILAGQQRSIRLYGRPAGVHFYRVRAEAGPNVSPWSNGVAVGGEAQQRWVVEPEDDYEPDVLLAVHRALLRLCAARGDLIALLSVPEHYRGDAAVAHARRLRSPLDPAPAGSSDPVPGLDRVLPLDGAEQRALGFGALYHPWLVTTSPSRGEAFRRIAPDGPAAGVIARRSATRGAWVAPANEAFADVIALVHPEPREALASLQEAQVNEVRPEPGGFMCLCEDTLIRDEDVRPINVRRLLALVRRLVLLEGSRYVFEPNDPTFRRSVERGFGDVMQLLHMLGAFAGRTPEEAYRVNAGSPPNTPHSVDAGRLIVELKLAPSRPLSFLLVRLVNAGERGFELETP
jgi:hypothetical protein